MHLTFDDWMMLIACVSVAGFFSYAAHEVEGAIHSYLNDD